jgi:hypothetical protein
MARPKSCPYRDLNTDPSVVQPVASRYTGVPPAFIVAPLIPLRGSLSRYSDWLRARRPRGQSWSPGGGKNIRFSISSRPALGPTQPPIQWVPGALSPGVKLPGRKANHSPPTSAEVTKMWVYQYTSTPPYAVMAQCLIS